MNKKQEIEELKALFKEQEETIRRIMIVIKPQYEALNWHSPDWRLSLDVYEELNKDFNNE